MAVMMGERTGSGGEVSSEDLSFLTAVLESTADGILVVDLEGKITGFNQKFVEMWDLPREIVEAGKSDEDALQMVLPELEDPQTFLEKVKELYARIDASSFDRFEFKDGRVFERYSQPQVQQGKIVGRVWSFRDVTEQNTAEAACRSSEERLRMALSASQMGIWDWNIATGEVLWGYNIDKVLEIDRDESPKNLEAYRALVYPEDLKQVDETLNDILLGRIQSFRVQHRVNAPNGKLKWLEVWGQAKCSMDGAPVHLFGAILDITTSKESEQEIRRLNRQCENKVKLRTKQLQDAYQDLEAFSYSVSHDLRAPLRHINSFLGLIPRRDSVRLDPQTVEYLNHIESASKRMAEMVEALLEFSRLGHKPLHKTPIDLNVLVGQIKEELAFEAAGRNIVWQIHHLPGIVGGEPLIRTVFINLISNAIKFTREKEVAHIEIGSQPDPEDNRKVTVYIRDDGVGFDMSHAQRLFVAFQRLHHQGSFEGTGVGLASVRKIVELHSGKIWAAAAPGLGATFYLTLPLDQGPGVSEKSDSVQQSARNSSGLLPQPLDSRYSLIDRADQSV